MSVHRTTTLVIALCSAGFLVACHHTYFLDGDGVAAPDLAADVPPDLAATPCDSLACRQNLACPAGAHTTLSGTIYAPNGTLPLYNATVFVPTTEVEPYTDGVTCDRCDGTVTGHPLAVALSGPDGRFTLKDVPRGDIPLVIELGRWRREVTIPGIVDCEPNEVSDAALTRLPRKREEGHIPQIAIATGNADPFECLLLKVGIDSTEITAPEASVPGRVHFYRATDVPGTNLAGGAPGAQELYASLENLLRYDVVLLPCEGGAYDKSQVQGVPLASDPRPLIAQYLNAGGRMFATHFSYDWLTYANSPFNVLSGTLTGAGLWPVGQPDDFNDTIASLLNVTFPKGAAFAEWLKAAGATSSPAQLDIKQGRHDLTAVNPALAQPWVTYNFASQGGGPAVMHFTANTPLDPPIDDMGTPAYCGRMVFSDFHVTAAALASVNSPSTQIFPAACLPSPMTDQEKALAFMLFDLSSCVQQDTTSPIL